MKVAIYTDEFLSPSMTFIHRQISQIMDRNEVAVLARYRANSDLFPFERVFVEGPGIYERVWRRTTKAVGHPTFGIDRRTKARFSSLLRTYDPDVIHAHFGPSALEILPIAMELGIPMVTTFHGFDASSDLKHLSYVAGLQRLFRYSHIITVSDYMAATLIEYGANPDKIRCIYIGVPINENACKNREAIKNIVERNGVVTFLQVANFVEKKGHAYTIEAFAQLLKYNSNCVLILAGDGPLRRDALAQSKLLGIEDRVNFVGHLDSGAVAEAMAAADCFLHHSVTARNGDSEGIPTVIMEAMASGLPVISTRHSGIPELISNRETGFLVDERDVPSYVKALVELLDDDGELGARARKFVARSFNIVQQTKSLEQAYEDARFADLHPDL